MPKRGLRQPHREEGSPTHKRASHPYTEMVEGPFCRCRGGQDLIRIEQESRLQRAWKGVRRGKDTMASTKDDGEMIN